MLFAIAILIISGQIFEAGFTSKQTEEFNLLFKPLNLVFSILSIVMSWYLVSITKNRIIRFSRIVFFLISLLYAIISLIWWLDLFNPAFDIDGFRMFLALLIGFLAISFKIASLGNSSIHPALLFILSFIFLILFGTFCLMLPAAAYKNINFMQAFFTSTSAVTVTGLAVLDTGKDFTLFGQTIILILIQLGGIGILTVTNIFALLFNSSSTFRNRMMVSDMIKELDSKNTFSTLFKIITMTLLIEIIGAILIYFSICNAKGISENAAFFAVFHSVSAFCNGGFSTLSNSLFEESVKYNYYFQLIICWLIISGGIGYSVMINHYRVFKNSILNWLSFLQSPGMMNPKRELVKTSTNSYIIILTSSILLVMGTFIFYISEYHSTLSEHSAFGKVIVSFFNSTTARTAGFNNVNMGELSLPAFMLIMALMWIGASPGSTGGGIKTTTFALALLNLWNQIKGTEKLIIKNKEVPANAINLVNAVILLSIFAIGSSTFLLSGLQPDIAFKDLLFESVSAYSTVGLSVGITSSLSQGSLLVLIILMFLGRVSFLTFLIGLFSQILKEPEKGPQPYYTKANVFVN
ncbi:MAG: potassium transporter TrkG [Saprospiraceae bacterium]